MAPLGRDKTYQVGVEQAGYIGYKGATGQGTCQTCKHTRQKKGNGGIQKRKLTCAVFMTTLPSACVNRCEVEYMTKLL